MVDTSRGCGTFGRCPEHPRTSFIPERFDDMTARLSRRDFVRNTTLASAVPLALAPAARTAQVEAPPPVAPKPGSRDTLPMGRIGSVELSRVMLGGNLISGYAHSRDLTYVAQLMTHYNTEARILETLETAEAHGINAINLAIWDDLSVLRKHGQRGGKLKLVAQAIARREGDELALFKKAVDFGACAVHLQGHGAEILLKEENLDLMAKIIQYLQSQKVPAGIAAHGLNVIIECEKARIEPDFYVKTLHTHDYHTAPRPGEKGDLGRYDNSWCADPEEVVDFMWGVKKPWIAFKIMAAGAIPPQRAFPHAFNSGADFVLAGMFDWQIAEDVRIAKAALSEVKRTRRWFG